MPKLLIFTAVFSLCWLYSLLLTASACGGFTYDGCSSGGSTSVDGVASPGFTFHFSCDGCTSSRLTSHGVHLMVLVLMAVRLIASP